MVAETPTATQLTCAATGSWDTQPLTWHSCKLPTRWPVPTATACHTAVDLQPCACRTAADLQPYACHNVMDLQQLHATPWWTYSLMPATPRWTYSHIMPAPGLTAKRMPRCGGLTALRATCVDLQPCIPPVRTNSNAEVD